MRLGIQISETNGPRVRVVLEEEEIKHLTAGWPDGVRPRFQIQGDPIKGIRIAINKHRGLLMQAAGENLWVFTSCRSLGLRPEAYPTQPIEALLTRDEEGPLVYVPKIPESLVPSERKKEWTRAQNPAMAGGQPPHSAAVAAARVEAEKLFKGAARVKAGDDTPWGVKFDQGRHFAVLSCAKCHTEDTINLAHNLPHEVIRKKFVEKGWEISGGKCICAECLHPKEAAAPGEAVAVKAPETGEGSPASAQVESHAKTAEVPHSAAGPAPAAAETTTRTAMEPRETPPLNGANIGDLRQASVILAGLLAKWQTPQINDLKAAVDMINELIASMNDPTIHLKVVSGKLRLFRLAEM